MPNLPTDTTMSLKNSLLSRTAMTPLERLHGRFMRAPDHDAGTGDGDPPAGDEGKGEGDAGKGAEGEDNTDGTILGGDPTPDEGGDDQKDDKGEGDDKKDEAKDAKAEVPETYELKPPEGFEKLDQESLDEVVPLLKELGATNEKAQTLIDHAGKFAQRIQTQQQQLILDEVNKTRTQWAEEARNDKEIGGQAWEETEHLAAKALDTFGAPKGSPFRSFLTDTGLGNHPEMIRMMRKIGAAVGEDNDFARAAAGAQIKKSTEEILYPNDVKEGTN